MSQLKTDFFKGVFYTGIARYAGIIFRVVVSAILARIIAPEDFGVVAIAAIFINFFSVLTTVGIGPAIVQNKDMDDNDLRKINGFTFVIAIVLTSIFVLFIPLIISFYDNNELLRTIMILLSVNIFFSIAAIVPNAVIMKKKLFGFIAGRTFVIQVISGIIAVLCALWGMGIYALLINPMLTSIALFLVNFKKEPIGIDFRIKKSSIEKILSFSIFQALFNVVYLCYRNLDKIVIGKFFGMNTLGYYEKSYGLMLMPLENVSTVISPVLHPLLSEYQNEKEHIWDVYLRMLRMLSEFGFILSVTLFYLADVLIILLFGNNWQQSVPFFKILSLSVSFQLLQAPIGAVLQSINKVKALFYGGLWVTGSMILCLLIGVIAKDMTILTWGITLSFTIGFVAYQFYLSHFFEKKIAVIIKLISPYVFVALLQFVLLTIIQVLTPTLGLYIHALISLMLMLGSFAIQFKLGLLKETTLLAKTLINKLKK